MSEVILESDNWKALAADAELVRARSRLSMHELRLIMRHGGIEARAEIERLRGTLLYLKKQAENGTLHPQVVIQNVDSALAATNRHTA